MVCPKLGYINAFGADPRRIAMAGHDVDNAEPIDFAGKYDSQNTAFKTRYDSLGGKFNGKTLDDYTGGTSFCCGDKSLDEIEKNEGNGSENAKIEDNLYFYHPDHLGSTSLVTNSYGEITQNISYIPYGEVFVEETAGGWLSPYYFNANELDEETGLYYYGARYLDPAGARWLSADPMLEKYMGMSPYNYCAGNPVRYVDPDGKERYVTDEDGTTYRYDNSQYFKYDAESKTYNKAIENSKLTPFLKAMASTFEEMQKTQARKDLYDFFSGEGNNVYIFNATKSKVLDGFGNAAIDVLGKRIYVNPNKTSLIPTTNGYSSENSPLWITVAHEMAHRRDYIQRGRKECNKPFCGDLLDTERVACHWENVMRGQSGLPLRTCYNSMENSLLLEDLGGDKFPNWSNKSRYFSTIENGLLTPYKY